MYMCIFCICFLWVFLCSVFPLVLWYCWLGLLTCKIVSQITYTVLVETLNTAQSNPISFDRTPYLQLPVVFPIGYLWPMALTAVPSILVVKWFFKFFVCWCCCSQETTRKWKTGCWRCLWTRRLSESYHMMRGTRMKPAWQTLRLTPYRCHVSSQVTAQTHTSLRGEWVSSVLRPRQHSIGYMGDGFYRSKDPTNSIKVLKEMLQKENNENN